MLREALTALHAILDTIKVREYDHLVTGARPSKLVKPAQPKTITELEIPKITIDLYDMRHDPGRHLPCQIDIESDQYVDGDESYDTDSTAYIPAIDAPEPWKLFFQIELISSRQHDEITLIEQISSKLSYAQDINVSYTIGDYTITWPCHLNLVDIQRMSDGSRNEFNGRIIYSYAFEAWKWPDDAEISSVPLINERIIQRGASGTEADEDLYNYVKNLDL